MGHEMEMVRVGVEVVLGVLGTWIRIFATRRRSDARSGRGGCEARVESGDRGGHGAHAADVHEAVRRTAWNQAVCSVAAGRRPWLLIP